MVRLLLILGLLSAAIALPQGVPHALHAQPSDVLTVNSGADPGDGECDDSCTLRDAILTANAREGPDRIEFAIGEGPVTIRPLTALPVLEDGGTLIDGSTQPGESSLPLVYLDGAGVALASGLLITGADVEIRGLAVGNFVRYGLAAIGETAQRARFIGNWVGLSPDGRTAAPNQLSGIGVLSGAGGALVGDSCDGCGNRVAGNSAPDRTGHGILIGGSGSLAARVLNNVIGLNVDGAALPNDDGILIVDDAHAGIGGRRPGEANLISGNRVAGIEVRDTGFLPLRIEGNWIGLSESGDAAVANDIGVFINGGAARVTVGGTSFSAGNVISGNRVGIAIEQLARDVIVVGNLIGLDPLGLRIIPNVEDGVSVVAGARDVIVGGPATTEANWIGGNGNAVVIADPTTANVTVRGNRIGVMRDGVTAAPNAVGIAVMEAQGVLLGGSGSNEGNVIVASGTSAVVLDDVERAQVIGNRIGLLVDDRPLANNVGVTLQGGTTEALVQLNRIGGNTGAGIVVLDEGTRRNRLTRNVFLTNGGIGIDLGGDGFTPEPVVGGTGPNAGIAAPSIDEIVQVSSFYSVRGRGPLGVQVQVYLVSPTLPPFADAHPSGFGAGGRWLGGSDVDDEGNWELTLAIRPDATLTVLSVDPAGNTSEFGENRPLPSSIRIAEGLTAVAWLGPELPAEEAFQGFSTSLQTVFRFDPASGGWLTFRPGLPASLSTLATVTPGDALWIALSPGTGFAWAPPRAEPAARSLTLQPGLNFVSWSGPPTAADEALDPLGDAVEVVFRLEAGGTVFTLVFPRIPGRPAPEPLQNGALLWLRASRAVEWTQLPDVAAAPADPG